MARIPKSSFRGKISADVPQVAAPSVSQAGAQFQGLKAVAKGAETFTRGLVALNDRRDKAKSDSYANTMQSEFMRDDSEDRRGAATFFEGSSYDGYSKERQNFAKGRREFYKDNAPNERAKERVDLYFDRISDTSFIKDSAFESRKASQHYLRADEASRVERSNTLFENPSLDMAAQSWNELNVNSTNSELYDPIQKIDQLKRNKDVITATLDGLLNSGGADLVSGKNFLEGKSKYNGMLESLSPKLRASYENKFQSAIKTETNKNIKTLSNDASNLMKVSEVNGFTPETKKQLEDISASVEQFKTIEGINKVGLQQVSTSIKKTIAVATDRDTYKNRNLTDIVNDKNLFADGKVTTGEEADILKARMQFVNSYIKEAINDPAALSVRENSTLKEGTQELFEYQVSRNFPTPSYYSKAAEKNLIGTFKTSPGLSKELEDFLSEGDLEAKKNWLDQVSRKDKFMTKLSIAANTDDKLVRHLALDVDASELSEQFKTHPGTKGEDDRTIEAAVVSNLEDFSEAFSGEGNASVFNFNVDMVKNRVKQLMISGSDKDDAVDAAIKDIIEDNYTIIEVGGRKTPLSGRFKTPASTSRIQAFSDTYSERLSDDDTIKDLGIDMTANIAGGSKVKSNKEFMEIVSDQNGKLVLSDDGKGFVISYEHPLTGNIQKVKAFKENPVGGPSHVDLVIPFEDIVSMRSPYSSAINKELSESSFIGGAIKERVVLFKKLVKKFKGENPKGENNGR